MEWFSLKWFSWQWIRNLHWDFPEILYLLPVVPLLFWIRRAIHGKDKQRISVSTLFKTPLTEWVSLLRFLPHLFYGLALATGILAVARPQTVTQLTESFSEGIDIVLAIDISESMLERDLLPNRLSAAKKIAKDFIENRIQDRIGLVIFAGEAYSICPLTTDYALLGQYIESLETSMIPEPGTAIGSALAVSTNRMRDSRGKSKVLILLSDGDNTSGNLDPITMARLAEAYGVRIYSIAVGKLGTSTGSEKDNVLVRIAPENQYFRAVDNQALERVFSEINQLETDKFQNSVYKEVNDFYRVYLTWAIVLFLISLGLKTTFMSNVLED